MYAHIVEGRWQQLVGAITVQWGQVTGNPLRVQSGRHLQRVGGLHAACGRVEDEVARQIDGVQRRSRALRARTGL